MPMKTVVPARVAAVCKTRKRSASHPSLEDWRAIESAAAKELKRGKNTCETTLFRVTGGFRILQRLNRITIHLSMKNRLCVFA